MADEGDVLELAKRRGAPNDIAPKPPKDMAELGVASSLPMTSWESFTTGAQSKIPVGSTLTSNTRPVNLDQLVEMRQRDGQARALYRLLTLPILGATKEAEWVEPEGSEGGADQEVEFANMMFDLPAEQGGMSLSLSKLIRQVALAVFEGFAFFEKVWQVPSTGPLAGKITLRKLAHRDSRTMKFVVDETGGFDGALQQVRVKGEFKEIMHPKEKSWYFAVNEEENAFYGVSMFEQAWFHWDLKRKLYYLSHIGAQFAAVPGRVGTVPPQASPKDIQAFKAAIEDFAFNTAMLKKEGYTVDSFNGNTGFDFMKLIDHQNLMMSASVLAKFLDQENRQVLIDNGRGDASADMFVLQVESIMTEIAENLTRYVMPQLIDWNFGSAKYPVFRFGVINDATRDVIKDLLTGVATAQASKYTDEFIREMEKKMAARLGLDIDYEEIQKREDEEMAEAQKQMRAMGLPPGTPPPPGGFGGGPPQRPQFSGEEGGATLSLTDIAREIARQSRERGE